MKSISLSWIQPRVFYCDPTNRGNQALAWIYRRVYRLSLRFSACGVRLDKPVWWLVYHITIVCIYSFDYMSDERLGLSVLFLQYVTNYRTCRSLIRHKATVDFYFRCMLKAIFTWYLILNVECFLSQWLPS